MWEVNLFNQLVKVLSNFQQIQKIVWLSGSGRTTENDHKCPSNNPFQSW